MNTLVVMTKFVPKIIGSCAANHRADGMKMNERMLLSPVHEVANEKLETDPKEMVASLSLYETRIAPKIGADEFGHLFIECVEQTLTDLLGAKVREALLDYLARHDRLARGDIPGHPRELSMLLDKTFGKGSITIEKCIIRRLYAILEWEHKQTSNFNFANQVEEARTRWKTSQDASTCTAQLGANSCWVEKMEVT
jgi:hypothetical protein